MGAISNDLPNCFPADTCHKIGVNLYADGKFLESIPYSKKAAELRIQSNDPLLWKSFRNIGIAYYNINFFNEAIDYLQKSLSATNGYKKSSDSLMLFKHIADSYYEIGETEISINYLKKAININVDKNELAEVYRLYAKVLRESNDSSNMYKAIDYANIAIEISGNSKDTTSIKNAFEAKANALFKLNNLASAKINYQQALSFSIYDEDKAIILNGIAIVETNQKKYKQSIETLKKALNLYIAYHNTQFHYDYATCYENLADSYAFLQQFDTALLHYQKALINLTNNFRTEDILKNPNPIDTNLFIYSYPDIIRVLHLKATAAYQYYQKTKNQKYLDLANQTYQTAFNFHDKLQRDISTENSRLLQAKNIVPYIENALKITYQQQENGQDISKTAFRFMEKNKATVLLQSMNEADALQFANLPDSLLAQEKDFKIALTYHNKQLNEAIEYEDTIEIERLNNLLFEEKQQYNQLITNLENNYPNYYRLKYQQNQTQLTDVKNTLDDKTALLEYFVGDSSIYILSVQKEQSKLYQIDKPTDWQQTINNFRQSLTLKDTSQSNSLDIVFAQSAAKIYSWLLDVVITKLSDDITTLQIIPDGVLNYIPFGVLLSKIDTTQKIDYKTLPYLIKEKAIGYSYSSALWLEQQEGELETKDKITYAGFAPEYGVESGQFKLPFANESVKENADLFKGEAFIGNQATDSQFKKSAPQFNILQLAMHVLMDDKKPMETKLLFNQTQDSLSRALRAADLYNMELKANLAVLGACNTGSGQLQNGEGVMSLSRAFTYAGTSSLVMSLWSIVDESTAVIVNQFFKNLQQGASKHIALQQAKLNFLDNATQGQTHPKYWAGLVVSGNQKALANKTNYFYWALFVAILFVVGFGFMRSKF